MIDNFSWTPNLAYVVGLLVTDGCLSSDGRHIDFTSKDLEQVTNFKNILKLTNKIGTKTSSYNSKEYYRIQFGNVRFYRWLQSIGIQPRKTHTITSINIPDKFFWDFLRGHLDGDGYTYSYHDPRWPNSFLFYTAFISASEQHIVWVYNMIEKLLRIKGKLSTHASTYQVRYAKISSLKLMESIYYRDSLICLSRKRNKVKQALQYK